MILTLSLTAFLLITVAIWPRLQQNKRQQRQLLLSTTNLNIIYLWLRYNNPGQEKQIQLNLQNSDLVFTHQVSSQQNMSDRDSRNIPENIICRVSTLTTGWLINIFYHQTNIDVLPELPPVILKFILDDIRHVGCCRQYLQSDITDGVQQINSEVSWLQLCELLKSIILVTIDFIHEL